MKIKHCIQKKENIKKRTNKRIYTLLNLFTFQTSISYLSFIISKFLNIIIFKYNTIMNKNNNICYTGIHSVKTGNYTRKKYLEAMNKYF
jgi:hypothetical protein